MGRRDLRSLTVTTLGAVLGAFAGGFLVIGVTLVLKAGIDLAASQGTWFAARSNQIGRAHV